MANSPLPVAVIGVGGFGRLTLQALMQSELVKVVGLADKDPSAASRAAQEAGVPAFTDNRSLLAEARPQAVFLAVPPMAAPDLVVACAERGIHLWKELPLARNLPEAVAMVRRMQQAGLKLAVGTQRRFALGYRRAYQVRQKLGEVFLGRGHYLFNWGAELKWRGDKASAGGGALLELGYHPIDLMVWLLGLPGDVYGRCSGEYRPKPAPGEKSRPIYDTDDTAAAILRYGGARMATVVTTRCSGPVSEELSLHGRRGSLVANAETCLLLDPDGAVLERTAEEPSPLGMFRRQVDAFVKAVLSEARHYECSGLENLLNLAVIDAIYLSNRTSQPENPSSLLGTHGLTVEDCLQFRPPETAGG